MGIWDRMFASNSFKVKYPLLDKYVVDSSVRDNLLKNSDLLRKYQMNETLIKAFVFELDKHFDKETIYSIITKTIFSMPDITLQSFIESYLNSDEVTKSNTDVVKYYKTISQYGIDSTKYIEKNGIITNRSFKEVPLKVVNERYKSLKTGNEVFGITKLDDIYESLSYTEKNFINELLENKTFNNLNSIYELKLDKYNINTHFDLKQLISMLLENELDHTIFTKDIISKIGEDNILFLSYMIFGMENGKSVTRIIKYLISKGKYDLVIRLIVGGLIPTMEKLSVEDIKHVEDEDLVRILTKKSQSQSLFLSLNKNIA